MDLYLIYILLTIVFIVLIFLFYQTRKRKKTILKLETQRTEHRVLLEEIVDSGGINITDNFGNTPLILSVRYAFDDIFEKIIDQTTNLNSSDTDGHTASHFAAVLNNKKVLVSLANHGANLNALSRKNETPISLAIRAQAFESVGYLVGQKVNLIPHDVQQQTITSLIETCWFNTSTPQKHKAQKEELRDLILEELKFQTLPS